MNSERIKILEQFAAEDPSDPFNQYALALELAKSHQPRAKEIFDQLIFAHPHYVPAYYHAALLYLELQMPIEASGLIRVGIKEAADQKNQKAVNELKGLLDEIE